MTLLAWGSKWGCLWASGLIDEALSAACAVLLSSSQESASDPNPNPDLVMK